MWCPFALHKPLSENHTQGHITPRAVILHTAVTNADSLFGFFENDSNLESHFYVRADGTIEQYMDTQIMADANKNANAFAVSIETWDGGTVRPWTPAQLVRIIQLIDWVCAAHGIPRVQIPEAYGAGIGWHTMFGAPGPWTPVAKSCPGAPRIEQTKSIIIPGIQGDNVSELIAAEIKKMMWEGGNVPGSVAPLTLIDDVRRLKRMLWEGGDVPGDVAEGSAIARVRAVEGNVATLREEVGALHSKIDHLTSLLEGLQ